MEEPERRGTPSAGAPLPTLPASTATPPALLRSRSGALPPCFWRRHAGCGGGRPGLGSRRAFEGTTQQERDEQQSENQHLSEQYEAQGRRPLRGEKPETPPTPH